MKSLNFIFRVFLFSFNVYVVKGAGGESFQLMRWKHEIIRNFNSNFCLHVMHEVEKSSGFRRDLQFSTTCFFLRALQTFVRAAIKERLGRMAHNKVHRQTGHKMIIDRNKILKYRDIKAIRRMLEVMYCEAVPRTVCRQCTKKTSVLSDRREIEIQVK